MKKVLINCNAKGEVNINDNASANGISIALVNEKHVPIARYEFSSEKTSRLTRLLYDANNVRIHFLGDVIPTMVFELTATM